ncbi:putative leucine-, glutamate-and lysine-rich protein [Plasmopara halstedii]
MAAFLPLHSDRKSELRDPTLEELYTGPIRALPDEIQQLPDEDTACTFCGVSYFIFAEVQTLQTTVKQYKKAFRVCIRHKCSIFGLV